MDEDDISMLIVAFLFILFILSPLFIILAVTTCVAHSKTKQWRKEKAALSDPETTKSEAESLIKDDSDSELDPNDSDDEIEIKVREEKRQDMLLTPKEKFRKEWKKAWKGDKLGQELQKAKEQRDERKKLAKAVAKELAKMERRKQQKADRLQGGRTSSDSADCLPAYKSTIDKKN